VLSVSIDLARGLITVVALCNKSVDLGDVSQAIFISFFMPWCLFGVYQR
jgi:hypothetical protein